MFAEKDILDVLHDEFIEYASPIIVNNLPSIDGLLPVNRKVIWGLHKQKITHDKPFIKMLRASGYVLPYYIFGDMPLTSAMKNMGNNTLNHKYLDPKGSFGDKRKKDGKGASPRYIECRLSEYSEYLLKGINSNSVPMKKNYDLTEDEPIVLPSIVPNILINNSQSIAVGESSKIPSHNIIDVCNSFINYIKTKDIDKSIELIKGVDVPTSGKLIYNKEQFENIYKTGRGSFTLIGDYKYNEKDNKITITEVPYETYIEDIEKMLREKYEKGLFKEVVDIHDGSDKNGLQLDIYLKKNTDIDLFIKKLRKYTGFQSSLSCNFTILDLDGKTPQLMNLETIINKWLEHRHSCITNEIKFTLDKKLKELHKLQGLEIIGNDIDTAIKIIREAKKSKLALERLVEHFNLSQEQSDYIVSSIKLININDEWISNKTKEIRSLEKEIEDTKNKLTYEAINNIIIEQLEDSIKKFGIERKTEIIYNDVKINDENVIIEDYNCRILYTNKYIKKHLKQSDSHKIKEDEVILGDITSNNKDTIMIFTNKGNRHRINCNDLDTVSPSSYGQYIPSLIKLSEGEEIIKIVSIPPNPKGYIVAVYSNGKTSKVNINSFLSNNKILSNCYNTESKLIDIDYIQKDVDILTVSSEGKVLIFNTDRINAKGSRSTQGNISIKLNDDHTCVNAIINVSKDNKITLHTSKGKDIYIMLDDVSPNDNKHWYDYLSGKTGNQGNFVYNTRNNGDLVTKVTIE